VLKYDVTKNYNIKINASRNFRIPSFNDLYWQQGGNPDLDLKMRISTNWGKKFVFRPFDSRQLLLNKINDLIGWKPTLQVFGNLKTLRK
jgi:iron complex outermembrane receptor protein